MYVDKGSGYGLNWSLQYKTAGGTLMHWFSPVEEEADTEELGGTSKWNLTDSDWTISPSMWHSIKDIWNGHDLGLQTNF